MRVLLVLPGISPQAVAEGDLIAKADLDLLGKLTDRAGIEASAVLAVLAPEWHGNLKPKMAAVRAERPRMLAEIAASDAECIVVLGGPAARAILNKGVVPGIKDLRRKAHTVDGIDKPVYFTYSLEEAAVKPNLRRWIGMDLLAVATGKTESKLGDYVISTEPQAEFMAHVAGGGTITADLESYPGFDYEHPDARIRMCVVSHRTGWAQVVQATPDSRLPAWLVDVLENPHVRKAGSNIAFDVKWLRHFGINMQNYADTHVAEHVLDERTTGVDLKSLVLQYHESLGDYSAEMRALAQERGGMEYLSDEEMYSYAGGDGDGGITVYNKQLDRLRQQGLERPYELLMQMYPVLTDMTYNGAAIDMAENARLDAAYTAEIARLNEEIRATLGPINPRSNPQVTAALKDLVPDINLLWKRSGKVSESVAGEVLRREAQKHPAIGLLLDYRKRSKLHSTYVVGLRDHIKNGSIHPEFRMDVTETYRLSSRRPNGQNIPRNLKDELAPLNIKNQFVSRFPGGSIIECDESQIELRVAAMHSMDAGLIAAFQSGEDVHMQVAAMMFGVPVEQVTPELRQTSKTVNFRVLYAGGPKNLARALGIEQHQAALLIEQYFDRFSGMREYMARQRRKARADLHVRSAFGFLRRFDPPKAWNSMIGWGIERQAINSPIQTDAFMITGLGMVKLARKLQEAGARTKLILNVHDSVVADAPSDEAQAVAALMKECLENPDIEAWGVRLPVPLVADIKTGPSWGLAK